MTNMKALASPRLAAAITLALAGNSAAAATITVNSNDDAPASAFCNLRSAITSINNGAAAGNCAAVTTGMFGDSDEIVFAGALAASTITLSQGRFEPTEPMTIQGSGQTIDAHAASSVIYALYPFLTLNDLTISNGYDATLSGGITVIGGLLTLNSVEMNNNHGASGGAVGGFGGQTAKIRVNSSWLHGNSASNGAGALFGQNADLRLTDTALTDNSTAGSGGAVSLGGGSMTATDCRFTGNSAASGGAIATSASVTLTRATVSGNTASGGGGAVAFGSSSAAISLIDSTASGNSAANGGVIATTFGGTVTLTNSTLSGNTATGSGGGIYAKKYLHANLLNATISGNAAASGGGVWTEPSGSYGTTALNFVNSIVSANSGGASPDMGGSTAELSGHNNLFGTALNVAPINNAGNDNIFTNSPGLGSLQDNGGTTLTRALLAGSLAIEAGSNAATAGLTTDQRGPGYARVINGIVDIGAYEYLGEDRLFLGDFEP
jgi:predicted outer membrane repeat protein